MDIVISPSSDYPIYRQIEENIKTEILNHKLEKNTLLPSIRQLACDLNVSVITVKKAYEELEHSGFIYSFPGKGFYVCEYNTDYLKEKQLMMLEKRLGELITDAKQAGLSCEDLKEMVETEWNL